jgi:hypothetical protein
MHVAPQLIWSFPHVHLPRRVRPERFFRAIFQRVPHPLATPQAQGPATQNHRRLRPWHPAHGRVLRPPNRRSFCGVEFLHRVLQHVLPKGFRRSRNFGFLHPNSKRLIALLRLLVFRQAPPAAPNTSTAQPTHRAQWKCVCCGGTMVVVRRRIAPVMAPPPPKTRTQSTNQ